MNLMQRALKLVGESPVWRVTGRIHTVLYRATAGRIGHSAGRITNLLLTTTGRRSGRPRTVPLAYLADGQRYVVVASNGGADRPPAWWTNLRARPEASVQIGARVVEVVARAATPAEHAVLWPRLTAVNPLFGQYSRITSRPIPVVVLEPRA